MTRLVKHIVLFFLVLFVNQLFCYAYNDSTRVRNSIAKVAKKIARYKTVDIGPVGFSPQLTKQFERYIYLGNNATDKELVILTNHKNQNVRAYSFEILVEKGFKDIKQILNKHVGDTSTVKIRSGCISLTEHINSYFLRLLTPKQSDKTSGIKLTGDEVKEIKIKMAATCFLDSLFQKRNHFFYEPTQFLGYSRELALIQTPMLNKLLPEYCFFKTTFFSPLYEYMDGDVLTALAVASKTKKESLLIHSPTFTKESKAFMELFYGLTTSDRMQSVTVAKEIMSILAGITTAGQFTRLINLKEERSISFELWYGKVSWRIYDFNFDANNKLTHIKIGSGFRGQEMKEGYMRR